MEVFVMKKLLMCIMLVMLIFTQSCCSIFTSEPQTISVNSKPQGAEVKIGPYRGTTPYQVSIPRGKDYVIVATYGKDTQTLTLDKTIEPVYWVNILFWPGLIIDLATGKMFRYEPIDYDFTFNQ
jgi:hypothetical protein